MCLCEQHSWRLSALSYTIPCLHTEHPLSSPVKFGSKCSCLNFCKCLSCCIKKIILWKCDNQRCRAGKILIGSENVEKKIIISTVSLTFVIDFHTSKFQKQNRQTDRCSQADRQTDRLTDIQTDRQTDRQTEKQTEKQTDRQTDSQTGAVRQAACLTVVSLRGALGFLAGHF